MPDETLTLTVIQNLATSVLTQDGKPTVGVLRVTTPNGDTVNLALLPEQADCLSSMMSGLAVELMVHEPPVH